LAFSGKNSRFPNWDFIDIFQLRTVPLLVCLRTVLYPLGFQNEFGRGLTKTKSAPAK
jgi:hypothetical protein